MVDIVKNLVEMSVPLYKCFVCIGIRMTCYGWVEQFINHLDRDPFRIYKALLVSFLVKIYRTFKDAGIGCMENT